MTLNHGTAGSSPARRTMGWILPMYTKDLNGADTVGMNRGLDFSTAVSQT